MQGCCFAVPLGVHNPATPDQTAKQLMGQKDAASAENAATV